jgi:spore coat protein CotF
MMGMILFTLAAALFANDNAEFLQDVEAKRQMNCTFTYVGKQDIRPSVPHIGVDDKYIYFTMEPCNE